MRRFFFTLGKINVLCLVYFICIKTKHKQLMYPKKRKIDLLERKISLCHNPVDVILMNKSWIYVQLIMYLYPY